MVILHTKYTLIKKKRRQSRKLGNGELSTIFNVYMRAERGFYVYDEYAYRNR